MFDEKIKSEYTECYVAFLDILGFKQLVQRSKDDGNILKKLVQVLETVEDISPTTHSQREVKYEEEGKCVGASNEKCWITQVRAFSDSVVLFVPAETCGLSSILCKIRYLHDRLLELDCCLRGAVTIGDMYWNDVWSNSKDEKSPQDGSSDSEATYDRKIPTNGLITLGPALLEAYKLESECVVYPRVMFSKKLFSHIKKMAKATPKKSAQGIHQAARAIPLCSPTPKNNSRCISDFICDDFDSIPFLDLFHRDIDRNDTKRIELDTFDDGKTTRKWTKKKIKYKQFMRNTRKTIKRLLAADNDDKVSAKYLWLANYFNTSLCQLDINPLPAKWVPPKAQRKDS
jgi:hypothetical protein